MRVTIDAIIDRERGLVAFQTRVGAGVAQWVGPLPSLGATTVVELQVDDVLRWGDSMHAAPDSPGTALYAVDGGTFLVGELVQIDPDGVGILRLDDSIVMLSMPEPPRPQLGWVCVGPVQLELHDAAI